MAQDNTSDDQQPNQAADLIRQKIEALYAQEPSAKKELEEVQDVHGKLSKHQQYMDELSRSGKSLAEIQDAWHAYYLNLPDDEKHEVWQEFYAQADRTQQTAAPQPAQVHPPQQTKPSETTPPQPKKRPSMPKPKIPEPRTVSAIKKQLLGKVQAKGKASRSSHLRSIAFGLGMGSLVVVFLLFSFFNERIIAPFITPSRTVSSTPIITDPGSADVGPESKIIIPKINVEIPVVYDAPSINEDVVQQALERGVVHYPTTPDPGQRGNAVIFGHSSNNILNPGKYKFAFVLLSRLEAGDTFMLQKGGQRYVYRVYDKEIVPPTDTSVLGPTDKPATVTLITCDPPGTTINRLVVIGEQISPSPTTNVASNINQQAAAEPAVLPSDAPSLWERFVGWLGG